MEKCERTKTNDELDKMDGVRETEDTMGGPNRSEARR